MLVECLAAAPTPADAGMWAKEFLTGWALPARSPSGETADRWFTTVSLLDAQGRVRAAWGHLDRGLPLASAAAVDAPLDRLVARGVGPSRAQEAAVRAVCSATGPVVVEGPPGCGKTSVVAAAVVAAARHDRVNVIGSALALEAPASWGPTPAWRTTGPHPGRPPGPLDQRGTRMVLQHLGRGRWGVDARHPAGGGPVRAHRRRRRPPRPARRRPPGPTRGSGGVWPTLCEDATSGDRGRYVRLTDACRQQDPAEREAVALLRAGRTSDALHHWDHHGRIVGRDSDDQVVASLADRVAAQIVAGEDVLVLAATRDEAERAGFAIRTRLLQHGHLDAGHAQYGTLPLAEGTVSCCEPTTRLWASATAPAAPSAN